MLNRILGAAADGKVPHPRESIASILSSEIGELQRKWGDGRAFLNDFQEWAAKHKDRPSREETVEKFVHDHMHERVLARVGKARDVVIAVEVMYWEPPGPMLCVKVKVAEGDTVHPSAKFRTNLEFAPEPFVLLKPATAEKPSTLTPKPPIQTQAKPLKQQNARKG